MSVSLSGHSMSFIHFISAVRFLEVDVFRWLLFVPLCMSLFAIHVLLFPLQNILDADAQCEMFAVAGGTTVIVRPFAKILQLRIIKFSISSTDHARPTLTSIPLFDSINRSVSVRLSSFVFFFGAAALVSLQDVK